MLEEISVPEFTILTLLQIIVGLGLLNVWPVSYTHLTLPTIYYV